jgi:hypothetical protein
LMVEIIIHNKNIKKEVSLFRKEFQTMRYCFSGAEYETRLQQLHTLIN